MNKAPVKAVLYSAAAPNGLQEHEFISFLNSRYGEGSSFTWEYSDEFPYGFRLVAGDDMYDWSVEGRIRQLREDLSHMSLTGENIIPLLRETIRDWTPKAYAEQIGTVASVGDGIATVKGLPDVSYGEILLFSHGVRGMALDLSESGIGCILFDDNNEIYAGSQVKRTGKTAGVPVGDGFLGRVVNSLGVPLDGLGSIDAAGYRNIESPAPAIVDRQPVNTPLETGLLTIDSMFPIGRGQRELIIGDRQTGKTAIALDTILNQKGKDVICIYVSIGQKNSSVARFAENLRTRGALDYTIIVHASAGDSAPLQYIAPYAGCAMGEYFMEHGRDVLIVYDDLSKHAVAYRAISLLLGRSPGREAYPGDVFYLHSRLLERAAHLSDERGGGSMTALPIVETQAGDVSAYIPTNIISITDGQLFLESELFFSGQRPAVNVGLSVSRVGGDAQTKAVKKASGALRLDLAQYREMEVFSQFAGDLDDTTKRQLSYGKGLMRMLRQKQYSPYSQAQQVIILTAALGHAMQDLEEAEIEGYIKELLSYFESRHQGLCSRIELTGTISDSDRELILEEAKSLASRR